MHIIEACSTQAARFRWNVWIIYHLQSAFATLTKFSQQSHKIINVICIFKRVKPKPNTSKCFTCIFSIRFCLSRLHLHLCLSVINTLLFRLTAWLHGWSTVHNSSTDISRKVHRLEKFSEKKGEAKIHFLLHYLFDVKEYNNKRVWLQQSIFERTLTNYW